jgi:hypothetical protein
MVLPAWALTMPCGAHRRPVRRDQPRAAVVAREAHQRLLRGILRRRDGGGLQLPSHEVGGSVRGCIPPPSTVELRQDQGDDLVVSDVAEMTILDLSERQDGRGDLWHASLQMVDPYTKVAMGTVWHDTFIERDEAEAAMHKARDRYAGPTWSGGTIAYGPRCPSCSEN